MDGCLPFCAIWLVVAACFILGAKYLFAWSPLESASSGELLLDIALAWGFTVFAAFFFLRPLVVYIAERLDRVTENSRAAARQRRAAKRLGKDAQKASPEAIASLVGMLKPGADESLNAIAQGALCSLPEGAAQDTLCRLAVEKGNSGALAVATQAGYVPSEPPLRADLLALGGRWQELGEFVREGDCDAVLKLAPALARGPGDPVRAIAESALSSIPEGPAQVAFCRRAVERGNSGALAVATQAGYVPSEPPLRADLLALGGRWQELGEFVREGDCDAVLKLAPALARGPGDPVRAIAESALSSIPEGPAQVAFCRRAVERDNEPVLATATSAGYLPTDVALRTTLLALGGRWEELAAFDVDRTHLGAIYESASPELRRRISASARDAGRSEWVQVAVGGRKYRRLANMTGSEWEDVLGQLADPRRAADAWRLAQQAPPFWARALLAGIRDADALPEDDREAFGHVHARAAACGGIPFSVSATCVATFPGRERAASSLAFTADGSLLGSGRWWRDGVVRLWRLPAAERLAALAGQVLEVTPDESPLTSGEGVGAIFSRRQPEGDGVTELQWHQGGVVCLAIAREGSLLASGSRDRTIHLWRLPGGTPVRTLRGLDRTATSLAMSSAGRVLASGSDQRIAISLWRLPEGEPSATLRSPEGCVAALAIVPDGSLLASAGRREPTISLWGLPDGAHLATLVGGSRSWVTSLAFTPDGKLLIASYGDGTVRMLQIPDGGCVATLPADADGFRTVAISQDGGVLATSGANDGTIRLWQSEVSVLAATPSADLVHKAGRLSSLRRAGGGDGRAWLDFMLALVDRHRRFDIEVEICDHVEVGEFDIEIGAEEVAVDSQRLTKLQKQLADATPLFGGRRRRRAAEEMAGLAREASPEALAALAQAVANDVDESVREIASSALHSLPQGPARDVLCGLAVENGDEVALSIAATAGYAPSEPSQRAALLALSGRWDELEAFDLDDAHLLSAYEAGSAELRRRLAAAARAAGRAEWVQVAVGGRQRLRLAEMTASEWQDVTDLLARPDRANEAWRLAQEAPPLRGRLLLFGIEDSRALPDGDREDFTRLRALAELCGEEEVAVSATTGSVAPRRRQMDSAMSLAVAPTGSLLASGSWEKTVRVWRLPGGECVATLRGHKRGVTSLAMTPDGSLLASGSWDDTIRLWRLPEGEWDATLRGHESAVTSLAITPDGSLLASGSWDGTVCLWSLPGGERVATLRGHAGTVGSLNVTPDCSLLASGGEDGTIRLWHLPDGECLATLQAHQGADWSLANTRQGSLFASESQDGALRLWGAEIAALAATPVAVLARQQNRLDALRRDVGLDEQAWLNFMVALVNRHRRFDIEVEVAERLQIGEFDIEIEG